MSTQSKPKFVPVRDRMWDFDTLLSTVEDLAESLQAAHAALLAVKQPDEPGDMPDALMEQIEGALLAVGYDYEERT